MKESPSQMQSEISPPFPEQHQEQPGLESKLRLRPRFLAERYKAAGKLEGKIALITGGDSGIGRSDADSSFITGTVLQVMGGETTGG